MIEIFTADQFFINNMMEHQRDGLAKYCNKIVKDVLRVGYAQSSNHFLVGFANMSTAPTVNSDTKVYYTSEPIITKKLECSLDHKTALYFCKKQVQEYIDQYGHNDSPIPICPECKEKL